MFKKYVLSVSFFLLSLSFFSVRATALSYILLALLFVRNNVSYLLLNPPKRAFIALLTLNIFVALASIRHEIYFNYLVKFFGLSIYTLAVASLTHNRILGEKEYTFACRFFIAAHSTFFAIQLIIYLSTGKFIDFNNYVREVDAVSLYETKALSDFYIKIRATGLFSEPSFYSMTVLPISMLLAIHLRKVTPIIAIGFITSLLSLSIASMLAVALGYALMIFTSSNRKYLIITGLIALTLSIPSLYEIFKLRVLDSVDYDAVDTRLAVFSEFDVRGIINNCFGSGFLWDERNLIGRTHMEGYQVRDSSFFVYLFFAGGAFGLLALLITTVYFFRKNVGYLAAIFISLIFKFHVMTGMVWLIFIVSIYFSSIRTYRPLKHDQGRLQELSATQLLN